MILIIVFILLRSCKIFLDQLGISNHVPNELYHHWVPLIMLFGQTAASATKLLAQLLPVLVIRTDSSPLKRQQLDGTPSIQMSMPTGLAVASYTPEIKALALPVHAIINDPARFKRKRGFYRHG